MHEKIEYLIRLTEVGPYCPCLVVDRRPQWFGHSPDTGSPFSCQSICTSGWPQMYLIIIHIIWVAADVLVYHTHPDVLDCTCRSGLPAKFFVM